MSLRVLFCSLLVLGFSWYAYRNWFVSLCAATVLMAFMKHPDMPRNIAGIPGFNLWNILIANVILGWWKQRQFEEPGAKMPRSFKIAVGLYFAVILVSFLRFFINPTSYYAGTRLDIVLDYLVNSIRFLIPAFLFFEGCRTRDRVIQALGSIALLYFLLSVQVIRYVGLHPDLSGAELSGRASKLIQRSVGYDRVDMSMMLSGASWAVIALSNLVEKKSHRWILRGMALIMMVGQSLTGGRTGYITWGAIGLILCVLKWRRLLPLIPVAATAIVLLLPSVAERMLAGFGGMSGNIVVHQDDSEITSGRNVVWPVVIAKIKQNPIIGYGRQGMVTTGLAAYVRDVLEDSFPHPHEAYLEMLLDNGIVGLLCVIPIYFIALKRSGSLFLDRTDMVYETAGAFAMALLLALLIAAFGAQTLYPREGVVGMWAAIGVALRVSLERERKQWEDETATLEDAGIVDEVEDVNFAGSARVALGGA
jgi:O-antigen ligase